MRRTCRFYSGDKERRNSGLENLVATIRASCPDCGDVELTTKDVNVRVCEDDNSGTYTFRCPYCAMTVLKSAENRTIDLLIASGVTFTKWRLPAELHELHIGEPINHDDLLDFHNLINDEFKLQEIISELADLR